MCPKSGQTVLTRLFVTLVDDPRGNGGNPPSAYPLDNNTLLTIAAFRRFAGLTQMFHYLNDYVDDSSVWLTWRFVRPLVEVTLRNIKNDPIIWDGYSASHLVGD